MTEHNEIRTVIRIRDEEDFFDRVYDRLHTVMERYVFADERINFTLFVNAIPRGKKSEMSKSNPGVAYSGLKIQQKFLEGHDKNNQLTEHWEGLDKLSYDVENMKASKELFKDFETKHYYANTLNEYFNNPEKFTKYQIHEYPILKNYFDIKKDRFVSVPLIQFGEIDGVIHIIYENKGHKIFYNYNEEKFYDTNIKRIIKAFSIEYEGVFLAWHLSKGTYDLNNEIRAEINKLGKEFNDFEKQEYNPLYVDFWHNKASAILKILDYKSYYTKHYPYFISRIEQHRQVLTRQYKSVLRQAVITILLDSYAHNISAHALTTLSWIYSKRAELFSRKETLRIIQKELQELSYPSYHSQRFKDIPDYEEAYAFLVNRKDPISIELYAFFRFLQEKGGFWSGLTRDMNPGGLTTDMFDILWDGFARNALYLGTIVESEDIRTLHIDVTFYKPQQQNAGFIVTPEIEFEGRLSTVNLETWVNHHYDPKKDDCYVEIGEGSDQLWYDDYPELEPLSRFVQPGAHFAKLKEKLRTLRVFLPGAVVGKHALYNILENELRNVKHFTGLELERAQKQGLTLHISIQPASLDEAQLGELYRIGVWLGLVTPLERAADANNQPTYLIEERFERLWNDIIHGEDDLQPHIGGTNQDKVCAAMLFNSKFSSVQDGSRVWLGLQIESEEAGKSGRDKAFYPWITPAVASDVSGKEFQIPAPGDRFDANDKETYMTPYLKFFKEDKGFFKKYFHVWKGQDVLVDANQVSPWDNDTRFRIVYTSDAEKISKLRRDGILRALLKKPDTDVYTTDQELTAEVRQKLLFAAYQEWLHYWIAEERLVILLVDEKGNFSGLIIFDKKSPDTLQFFTKNKVSEQASFCITQMVSPVEFNTKMLAESDYTILHYAHANESTNPSALLYRRHGIMNRYFVPLNITTGMDLWNMPADRFAEWFEMMVTRICVVDSRIQHRMRLSGRNPQFFKNEVQMLFCAEDKPEKQDTLWKDVWSDETKRFVSKCHFLVMHLSFIEALLKEYPHSDKEDIGLFIEKELLPIWGTEIPHNFILVVTSGRGRARWWESFQNDKRYKHFIPHIIFRPIESLLNAVEGSATQKDDFELKYRFTKVLFGS